MSNIKLTLGKCAFLNDGSAVAEVVSCSGNTNEQFEQIAEAQINRKIPGPFLIGKAFGDWMNPHLQGDANVAP